MPGVTGKAGGKPELQCPKQEGMFDFLAMRAGRTTTLWQHGVVDIEMEGGLKGRADMIAQKQNHQRRAPVKRMNL